MFLPTTKKEMLELGWDQADIILVSGDSYIDSPYIGVALLGKLLVREGFRVAIIAQPDVTGGDDIRRLGEPLLFWGVSGGSVDSMVANYTALKKRRRQDDFTPGAINNRRPDRAVIVYANLIRRYFKKTKPIVLGGIEASLRRVTHYDFWSNRLRRPILFDAKSDYLIYGMGEKAALELAMALRDGKPPHSIRGLSYIGREKPEAFIELPSHESCLADKDMFTAMFHLFYQNNDPLTARGLVQRVGDRLLVQNPPQPNPTETEIDSWYDLDFELELHPYYAKEGTVRALDTIRFSINSHRGCYGECNFCAIAVHQGRTVVSRSRESIVKEAAGFIGHPKFKGIISDVGGPTANMYGFECSKKLKSGACSDKRCLFPATCKTLKPDHSRQIELLKSIEKINGIRKVFVASGIRYDMVAEDQKSGREYLKRIVRSHTSGQMKIAPEHMDDRVLELMGKPGKKSLLTFRELFYRYSKEAGKNQFLTYYFIAAHPGCSNSDMQQLKEFTSTELKVSPEQVQVFTPTPSTYSTLMYYTEKNPFTGEKLFVEKETNRKQKQKSLLTSHKKGFKNRKASTSRGDDFL